MLFAVVLMMCPPQKRRKRRREIDYVTEVPFEKVAPAGFFDTSTEDERLARQRRSAGFVGKNLQQLEARRRVEEEKRARQRDKKRVKKLQQQNLPKAIMQENALNDPGNFRKRTRLSMPAPQVSDMELEDIVKHGAAAAAIGAGEGTAGLLAQYGATPGATPMRTPRTPAGRNVVMEEARNLRKLAAAPTPLLQKPGESAELQLEGGTGFAGVTPAHTVTATPNVLADVAGATPARGAAGAATPMTNATPMRDDLSINQEGDIWGAATVRLQHVLLSLSSSLLLLLCVCVCACVVSTFQVFRGAPVQRIETRGVCVFMCYVAVRHRPKLRRLVLLRPNESWQTSLPACRHRSTNSRLWSRT